MRQAVAHVYEQSGLVPQVSKNTVVGGLLHWWDRHRTESRITWEFTISLPTGIVDGQDGLDKWLPLWPNM